jgi:hypothetical protein
MLGRHLWRNRDSWFVLVSLTLSLDLNAYLGWRIRFLSVAVPPTELRVGMWAHTLIAKSLGEDMVIIDWGSDRRRALVHIFRPSNPWCARNLMNIKALSETMKGDYRLVGLSLPSKGVRRYATDK